MADQVSVRGKQVFCDVCEVTLPSASLLPTHNKGKKHQRLLSLKQERTNSSRKSIYVRGFQNSGSIEEELTEYFSVYGKVTNVFLDKDKGVFAIVEFSNAESVNTVLTQESLPLLNGKRLTVKERTVNKAAPQFKTQKSRKCKHDDSQYNQDPHLETKEMAPFLTENLIVKLKSCLIEEEQVNLLMQELCLTDEDIKLRRLVCQLLQEVFGEVYPGASVVPFGSTVSGIGWKGSDLDVCLLTSKCVVPPQSNNTGVDYSLVIDMLRSFAPGCTNIIPVLTAKCPLIKFTHQPSGLSCDLSVNNRLGVANSDLLRCYMSLDPRIPQLVFIVRAWAKAKAVTIGRQLSNYALTLMVLYFLQMQNPSVVPSLQQGFESWIKQQSDSCDTKDHGCREQHAVELESKMIDNWNCSFFADIARLTPSQNTKSLSQLLEEFFYFFSTEFDFANCVVSIRHGQKTSITSVLDELKGLECSEMEKDKNCVAIKDEPTCEKQSTKTGCKATGEVISSTEKIAEPQRAIPKSGTASFQNSPGSSKLTEFKVSPVCVQDPFELVHNLTQNITESTLKHIIELMKTAHRICKDLNGCSDNPNNSASKFLDLFTVCRSSKKRKFAHCHSFFVEYQDISPQASCSVMQESTVNLATPREIFLLIVETLEREFGFKCELKSLAKRQCNSGKDSDSSQDTQPAKVSQVSHCVVETSTGSYDSTGNNSNGGKEEDQTRKSEEVQDNFSAICTAFENTWTHCRRERRKSLQPQKLQRNENSQSAGKDVSVEEKAQKKHSGKSEESKFQISSSCKNLEKFVEVHNVGSPILVFELSVSSSTQKYSKCGCTVLMEHAESKDFQLFGNFFSAYKKYFLGLITK
ncbi:speckle targeted PIP5K1A-regulated poly(A) polymerase-like isoform X2 [Oculina patagonica]